MIHSCCPGRVDTRIACGYQGTVKNRFRIKFLPALFLIPVLAPAWSGAEEKQLWADSVLGKKGPELVVETWLDGAKPDTAGKFVLIDFWATWCGPCREAIPELNAFHEKYKDKLVVIGISDETEAEVKALKEPAIKYHSAVDTRARMKKSLNVEGIPHVIVMDPQGIVRWEGFPFLEGHELTGEVLEKILAEHAAPAKEEKKPEEKDR